MQGANLSSSYVEDYSHRKLPSVVKWEGGGQSVHVSFDDGATKIPMVRRYASAVFNCYYYSCFCHWPGFLVLPWAVLQEKFERLVEWVIVARMYFLPCSYLSQS